MQGEPSDEWKSIVSRGDPGASVRIFYVHDFDFTDTAKEEIGGADFIPGRDGMVGDDTPVNLEVKAVAHEVGHILGLEHVDDGNRLMGTDRVNAGLNLNREDADLFNPTPPGPPRRPRVQRR